MSDLKRCTQCGGAGHVLDWNPTNEPVRNVCDVCDGRGEQPERPGVAPIAGIDPMVRTA